MHKEYQDVAKNILAIFYFGSRKDASVQEVP
jgi:hypothetical protein